MNQQVQDIINKVLDGDEVTFTTKSGDEVEMFFGPFQGVQVKVTDTEGNTTNTFFDPGDETDEGEMRELIRKVASLLS